MEAEKILSSTLPSQARVVIIGGGVIGCSAAYHLAKLGWRDVIVLERKQLTSGTTWHAAGLVVCGGFATETMLELAHYTRELYRNLEKETGVSTGFKPVGYIQSASSASRLRMLRKNAAFARSMGIEAHEISPAQFKALWPLADPGGVSAGFYFPDDGRANPVDVTMSLAKGARDMGVRFFEGVEVVSIQKRNGCAVGVTTTNEEAVRAEYVINCAGMWGRRIGKLAGVDVPLQAAEHYYLLTEPIEGVHPNLPILEDVDTYSYFREEVGGLMLGLFEPVAKPWGADGIPADFAFGEIQPDWDRMMPYIEAAMERVPVLKTAGVRKLFCGPESFTADMTMLVGEAPELKNFYVAAGMNSLGILLGGGVGHTLAHWIVDGVPPLDVGEINIDRMLPYQNNRRYLNDRVVEILGMMYKETFPNSQLQTARNVRKSILHEKLAQRGAFFASSAGWEYADWFAPEGKKAEVEKYGWDRQNWFEYNAAEHKACREDVVLMDMTMMSKFLVQGRDALKLLDRISVSNINVPVGKVVYTEWCNVRGGIEADLTVTRTGEESFMVVCSDLAHRHVETWMKRHILSGEQVFIVDMTSAYALINVQGPKSRGLLQRVSHADLSNESFPYMSMREIDVHYARALALRVTYQGELGYELYIPTEFAPTTFDALLEAGKDLGLKLAGMQTLNTLRIEKGYRDYGHDIDCTDTPLEAGLGFLVDFNKPDFIGREALIKQKAEGPLRKRFVQLRLDDPEPLLYYGEMIYRNGKRVGYVRSGAYGFTVGGAAALSIIEDDEPITEEYLRSGRFEIEVNNLLYSAKASLRPLYDPKGGRVRM
ncbi:MAG: 4-methylaminobutanoate oxidase (formaldehyde-forming) [Anaerolineales bacterium]|nr:4-methylaminobutanoate oxidase (formaldehyde-forming) [Anaerolineales bacterium]